MGKPMNPSSYCALFVRGYALRSLGGIKKPYPFYFSRHFIFTSPRNQLVLEWLKKNLPKIVGVFGRYFLSASLLNGMISVYTLIQDHDRSTAFHLACAVGALEIVKLFASKDPKICRITLIDAQGWTPLHLAALNNHPYVLKYLLEQVSS